MVLMNSTALCGQRFFVSLSILLLFVLFIRAFYPASGPYAFKISAVTNHDWTFHSSESIAPTLKALYGPALHPITAPNFTDESGNVYHLTHDPRFTTSLGKRVLILDVDTRPMTEDGQVFSHAGVKWPGMQPWAGGILSHYMYANIHGYDYQFVRGPTPTDRHVTWSKVPMLQEALRSHHLVVFLDQDALFHYPTIPIEWLLNYWNHTAETLLMVAKDPDIDVNRDSQGNLFSNTGFIIAQNSSRTHELFDAWTECPRDTRFPGCSHYAGNWPHEQGALTTHIKPVFDRDEDIHTLPCSEANGSPMVLGGTGCGGVFVRHFWTDGKPHPPTEFAENVMRQFTQQLHESFMRDRRHYYVDASNSGAS